MVMAPMFTLKNASIMLIRRNVKNRTIRPITTAVIVPLALSTDALSPPENIHLIDPQSR